MNYKAIVSYDGSHFNGFQKQKDYRSVQECLENALESFHKKKVLITGAGRTDKGVHSLNQVFNFNSDLKITENGLKRAMNSHLPSDIYIKSVTKVSDDFHSRYNALNKTYTYKINMGEYNPIEANYIYQLNKKLDVNKMKEASKLFIGKHNFYNFCGYQEEKEKNFNKEIYSINFDLKDNYLFITIKGNSFLRYMVRMIVAVLIEIGLNRLDESFIKDRLDKEIKNRCNYKVSGCGLYLVDIEY